MKRRIALGGYSASGKTTASEYLEGTHGFMRLGFATPLYELGMIHSRLRQPGYTWQDAQDDVISWVVNRTRSVLPNERLKIKLALAILEAYQQVQPQPGKNRTLLQLIGTEVGRGVSKTLWTKMFERDAVKMAPYHDLVNDNLRFVNEVDSCDSVGFVKVFIDAPEEIRAKRYEAAYGVPMTEEQKNHPSEAELEEVKARCDHIVDNSGDDPYHMRLRLDVIVRGGIGGGASNG